MQKYDAYRVVIINDGSTDETKTYLDALEDSRVTTIHHEESRGVNVARNNAFKTLKEGEWAVQLDDDDMLLVDALTTIADIISKTPPHIQVLCFNAITRTSEEEYVSGLQFREGDHYFDPTYYDLMIGMQARGDTRMVLKWTLFPEYLFAEDVNGFEGEWWMLAGRDNVGIRYVPEQTTIIDQSYDGEHLSDVAARRDPESFVRSYRRIFKMHWRFFSTHPYQSMPGALSALKLSIRAFNLPAVLYFSLLYVRGFFQLNFGTKWIEE
jgi:glycosyltransferase involved in cell wall biosynthesis